MTKKYTFSSESVGAGHPDKVADYIADSILDACLSYDPLSRVACEVLLKNNMVFLAGEITTKAKLNYDHIVRQAIRESGYTYDDTIFHADKVLITNVLTKQSPDIAMGVNGISKEDPSLIQNLGAGDQGIMFGFACSDTPELLPAPILFAHKINQEFNNWEKSKRIHWLRPDCKSQVAVEYENETLKRIQNIIISVQHSEQASRAEIEKFCIEHIIKKVIPPHLIDNHTEFFINPAGRFVLGGPEADAGLVGRKIIVDTYGGFARHGGGAFSGKDPSKVDRSAAYMCRWVAKNLVAAGFAKKLEIQIGYAIGHKKPTSLYLNTFGTSDYDEDLLLSAIQKVFSFEPAHIIQQLDLLKPIYKQTTNYGHFTKQFLPWESLSKVKDLQSTVKSLSSISY